MMTNKLEIFPKNLHLQAVILAAGRGKRLQPISNNRTKAMAPIAGKPIVQRVMETIAAAGITDFVLVIGPDDPDIRPYFAARAPRNWHIDWVVQQQRQGMGDALRQASGVIRDTFLLSACDNLVPDDVVPRLLETWHRHPQQGALLTLMRVPREKIQRSGIVALQGERVVRIVEKPHPDEAPSDIASMPLYIFSRDFLRHLPKIPRSARGEYELQDAIQMHIDAGPPVYGMFIRERRTLTTPQDLLALNQHFLNLEKPVYGNSFRKQLQKFDLLPPCLVEDGVSIGENCRFGPGVFIERGATIGCNVRLRNAVVLRTARVPDDTVITNEVIC